MDSCDFSRWIRSSTTDGLDRKQPKETHSRREPSSTERKNREYPPRRVASRPEPPSSSSSDLPQRNEMHPREVSTRREHLVSSTVQRKETYRHEVSTIRERLVSSTDLRPKAMDCDRVVSRRETPPSIVVRDDASPLERKEMLRFSRRAILSTSKFGWTLLSTDGLYVSVDEEAQEDVAVWAEKIRLVLARWKARKIYVTNCRAVQRLKYVGRRFLPLVIVEVPVRRRTHEEGGCERCRETDCHRWKAVRALMIVENVISDGIPHGWDYRFLKLVPDSH